MPTTPSRSLITFSQFVRRVAEEIEVESGTTPDVRVAEAVPAARASARFVSGRLYIGVPYRATPAGVISRIVDALCPSLAGDASAVARIQARLSGVEVDWGLKASADARVRALKLRVRRLRERLNYLNATLASAEEELANLLATSDEKQATPSRAQQKSA